MPDQAQLHIGQVVHNWDEVAEIFEKISGKRPVPDQDDLMDFYVWNEGLCVKNIINPLGGKQIEVRPCFRFESEGNVFPCDKDQTYTDAAVCFELTRRYTSGILHREETRPEPFVIDLKVCQAILNQVREWWPEAQLLMWNHFY